jgi:hypothetical protein
MVDFKKRSVRQQIRQIERGQKSKGGGGFRDRFTVPPMEKPTSIILYPGEYERRIIKPKSKGHKIITRAYDFAYVAIHYNRNNKRTVTCTSGLMLRKAKDGSEIITEADMPCVGCHARSTGAKHINRRNLSVFNIIELGNFHEIEEQARNGKYYKTWKKCNKNRCSLCDKGDIPHYGVRKYWPMGARFLNTLINTQDIYFSEQCKCGGETYIAAYICPNPKCQEIIYDIEEDPVSDDELIHIRDNLHECPVCGTYDELEEIRGCNECHKAQPLGIFDVVMTVSSTLSARELADEKRRMDSNITIPKWRPIKKKDLKKVGSLMEPFDFHGKIYQELGPEKQSEILDIRNPYEEERRVRHPKSVEYDDVDEDEDEDDDE